MKIIKPKKLNPGDTIGIITPSRHIRGDEKNIKQAINYLKNCGFKIKIGARFKNKFHSSSGSKYQRAMELNNMFANKTIKAIFCAIGGDSANQILDLIDYSTVKKNPKIIIGYSDITHLLIAINTKTNLVTFHGPNLAIMKNLTQNSLKQMISLLSDNSQKLTPPIKWETIKHGKAKGILMGGNLMVINALNKTEFTPNYKGKILFWEEIDDNLTAVEYQLHQLHLSGALKEISGMIVGHVHKTTKSDGQSFKNIILELTKNYDYPIIKTDDFGHFTKIFYTLPIGIKVQIDTLRKEFLFKESPTT